MEIALKASILIIISGCQYHPTYVTPLVGPLIDMMFLLCPTESGHYDAIIPYIYTLRQTTSNIRNMLQQMRGMAINCENPVVQTNLM